MDELNFTKHAKDSWEGAEKLPQKSVITLFLFHSHQQNAFCRAHEHIPSLPAETGWLWRCCRRFKPRGEDTLASTIFGWTASHKSY